MGGVVYRPLIPCDFTPDKIGMGYDVTRHLFISGAYDLDEDIVGGGEGLYVRTLQPIGIVVRK
jgi:hypothetical protein